MELLEALSQQKKNRLEREGEEISKSEDKKGR